MILSASIAAAAIIGGTEAEKQYPSPDKRWWSIMYRLPAQKPPTLASDVSRDTQIISTSSGYCRKAIRHL